MAAADQNTMRSGLAWAAAIDVEGGAARDHGFDRRRILDFETRQRRGATCELRRSRSGRPSARRILSNGQVATTAPSSTISSDDRGAA